jgi:hypothetical protein
MNYSSIKPRHRTLNVLRANALRKMYTLFSIASILWLTPTAASSKDTPPNACAIIAVKAHRLLPEHSLILNMHVTTSTGRKLGHAVLLIPLRSGFYIYDERGSFWFQGRFETYQKELIITTVMQYNLLKGEHFKQYGLQMAY